MKSLRKLLTLCSIIYFCPANADLIPSINDICQLNGVHKAVSQETDTNNFFAFGVSGNLLNNLLVPTEQTTVTQPAISLLRDFIKKPTQEVFVASCKLYGGVPSYEWAKNTSGDGGKSFPICVWFDKTSFVQDVAIGYGFAMALVNNQYFIANNSKDVLNNSPVTYTYEVLNKTRVWVQSPDSQVNSCPAIDNKTFENLKNSSRFL